MYIGICFKLKLMFYYLYYICIMVRRVVIEIPTSNFFLLNDQLLVNHDDAGKGHGIMLRTYAIIGAIRVIRSIL